MRRRGPQRPAPAAEQLPGAGAEVHVGLPGQERGLRPVIRGHRGEELVITAPVEPDDAAALPLGGELSLSWTGERRLRRVTVQLRERCHGDPPCRRVSVVGPPQREQRREGYRVPVMGAVELHAGGGRYEARLIDLSDGGLRGLLPTDASLPEGSSCRVALDLVRTGLRLDGVVTRVSEGVEGSCEVAVRFADVPVAVGDELRRYVFEAQRRARPSQSW